MNFTRTIVVGFNGKENDREIVGTGEGTQDYGMRIYNPSLGKFLSVDPIASEYANLTPYQFASNTPICGTDRDGLELNFVVDYNYHVVKWITGDNFMKNTTAGKVMTEIYNQLGSVGQADKAISTATNAGTYMAKKIVERTTTIEGGAKLATGIAIYEDASDILKGQYNAGKEIVEGAIDGDPKAYVKGIVMAGEIYAGGGRATIPLRRQLARSYYEKFGERWINSKLDGINFEKPVQTRTLKAGTEVIQWVGKDGIVGKYFAPKGTNPATLGVDLNAKGGGLKTFKLTEDVKVLESTAAEFEGNAGGGTQYFNPELRSKIIEVK